MKDDKKLEELEVKLDKVTDNLAREETKRVRAVVGMVLVLVILACVVSWVIYNNVKKPELDVGEDQVVVVPSPNKPVKEEGGVYKLYGEWGLTQSPEKDLIVGVYGLPKQGYNEGMSVLENVRFFSFRCKGLKQDEKVLNPVTGTYFEVAGMGVKKIVFGKEEFTAKTEDVFNRVVGKLNEDSKFTVVSVDGKVFEIEAIKEGKADLPCGMVK